MDTTPLRSASPHSLDDIFPTHDTARTCIVDGHGAAITVNRGHLVVKDGIGDHRRTRRYNRATIDVDRIVVLAPTGTVTLAAQRWIAAVGLSYLHLDTNGAPIVASATYGTDNPGLRRAQALAAGTPIAVEITHQILTAKLTGQRGLLTGDLHASAETLDAFDAAAECIDTATEPREFLFAESRAAAIYWRAWADVEVRFATRDHHRVPEHWRRFGQRSSPKRNNPRGAVNPANAILNYLYRLLEAQARLGILRVGLDPGIGILHADRPARDSLALDLGEPTRPVIDRYVHQLLAARTFAASDFTETPDGTCRINPPITHTFAEALPDIAAHIGPTIEHTAKQLASTAATRTRRVATPLTGANNAARHRSPIPVARTISTKKPNPSCRGCGAGLGRGGERIFCEACLPHIEARQVLAWSRAGVQAQAAAAASGSDPRQTPQARKRRSSANAARHHAHRLWNPDQPVDPSMWATEILPRIGRVSVADLAAATGLSKAWCSKLRRGQRVAHPMHWRAIVELLDAAVDGPSARPPATATGERKTTSGRADVPDWRSP